MKISVKVAEGFKIQTLQHRSAMRPVGPWLARREGQHRAARPSLAPSPRPPIGFPVAGFGFPVAGFGFPIGGFGFPVGGFGSSIGGFGRRAVSAGGTAVRMKRAERFKKQTLQPVCS